MKSQTKEKAICTKHIDSILNNQESQMHNLIKGLLKEGIKKSKSKKKKVAAVLLDDCGLIHNEAQFNIPLDLMPKFEENKNTNHVLSIYCWKQELKKRAETKNKEFYAHAELMLLYKYIFDHKDRNVDLTGYCMFITHEPCQVCLKYIRHFKMHYRVMNCE